MCKFDLYVCGSIYFCTVGLIFVEVRFICMQFDLFFAVLILNERVSLYLCAFNIGWTRFEDFVRNGTPYKSSVIKMTCLQTLLIQLIHFGLF